MWNQWSTWLESPMFAKTLITAAALAVVVAVVRIIQNNARRRIKDASIRYRVRKTIALVG